MLTQDKIIEIYCIADDFCKEFAQEFKNSKPYLMAAKSAEIDPARCLIAKS